MQIKIFNVSIPGGESMNDELNVFLRTHRILQTESHIVNTPQGSYWSFCVKY